jgi:HSP20 family molecular chaperone IbpA
MIEKFPQYPEAEFVAESMGEYIKIEIVAAGYTRDDIKMESRENGILVVGSPKKTIGDGRLVTGFSNFYEILDYEKFERKNITASIYNGILTIQLPVKEEFRSVEITIAEGSVN